MLREIGRQADTVHGSATCRRPLSSCGCFANAVVASSGLLQHRMDGKLSTTTSLNLGAHSSVDHSHVRAKSDADGRGVDSRLCVHLSQRLTRPYDELQRLNAGSWGRT